MLLWEQYLSFCPLVMSQMRTKGETKSMQIFLSPLLWNALCFSTARSVNSSCQASIPGGNLDFSLSSLALKTAQEHPAFCHFESLQDAGIYPTTQFWEEGLKDASIMKLILPGQAHPFAACAKLLALGVKTDSDGLWPVPPLCCPNACPSSLCLGCHSKFWFPQNTNGACLCAPFPVYSD